MDINYLKSNGIDVDAGIELLGDIEMYNDTLNDFMEEQENRMNNIEKYKSDGDMENYSILVHALKGDSKYLGFTKLAELALNHQLKSQDNDLDYINDHYDELITEVNRIHEVINKYLGR